MGIKGLCTEALAFLRQLPNVDKVIVLLPNLWRLDIEMDQETWICNCMVDLMHADQQLEILPGSGRKWITSGGLNFDRTTEQAPIFEWLYKHQGFLVIAKEHFKALRSLIDYCKLHNIDYHISTIQDPMHQLQGLDHVRNHLDHELSTVEYHNWFRFDHKFVDEFLGHRDHPSDQEHMILCKHIIKNTTRNSHGQTL